MLLFFNVNRVYNENIKIYIWLVLFLKIKQITFTARGVAELLDREIPAPAKDEVQVKLAFSTVSSGTERSNLIGAPNVGPNSAGAVVFPRVLGYSSAGFVEAVGENVTNF